MMGSPIRFTIGIIVSVLAYLAGIAVLSADPSDPSVASDQPVGMRRILVMPFQNMTQIHGVNNTVRGPVTRKVFVTQPVAPHGEVTMNQSLRQLFTRDKDILWQDPKASDVLSFSEPLNGAALINRLRQLGRQSKSDGILVGYLYGFQEREGGAYGAEKPARVTFEMALLHTDSGAVIWHKRFSGTQKPLNENLLNMGKFIKRKGRWITARDMGREALTEMLKTLPRRRPEDSRSGVTKGSQ